MASEIDSAPRSCCGLREKTPLQISSDRKTCPTVKRLRCFDTRPDSLDFGVFSKSFY